MTPATPRTWSRRGHTPVVRGRGRSRRRLSVAAPLCYKAGQPSRLIYRLCPDARPDGRKSFSWTDYRDLIQTAHHQLGGSIVLVLGQFEHPPHRRNAPLHRRPRVAHRHPTAALLTPPQPGKKPVVGAAAHQPGEPGLRRPRRPDHRHPARPPPWRCHSLMASNARAGREARGLRPCRRCAVRPCREGSAFRPSA